MFARTVTPVIAAAIIGTTAAIVPTAPALAAPVCLDNGPVTYRPAPGADPITVPACDIPKPLGGQPTATTRTKRVCGNRWWKRVPRGTRGATTRRGKSGYWVVVRRYQCRTVRVSG